MTPTCSWRLPDERRPDEGMRLMAMADDDPAKFAFRDFYDRLTAAGS